MPSRRDLLSLSLALGATWTSGSGRLVGADPSHPRAVAPELDARELLLTAPNSKLPRRAFVLVPARGPRTPRRVALVLFHGRGEAGDPRAAMEAWRTRYGLAESYVRLNTPSVVSICPATPNPSASKNPRGLLDEYAAWIETALLPAARDVGALGEDCPVGVDGCSMGGFVAAEVFVRKPHLFRTFGVVQPAVGQFRVASYARALAAARASLSGIHLLSSSHDPYLEATRAWSRELERLGARPTLEVLPGAHDQTWLRAAGTAAMLDWHDRQLRIPLPGRVL